MNAGLDAGPVQKMCGAGSVPGPDFGEYLMSPLNYFGASTMTSPLSLYLCFFLQISGDLTLAGVGG